MRNEDSPSVPPVRITNNIHKDKDSINRSSRVRATTIEGIKEIKGGKAAHSDSNSCTTSTAPNRPSSTEISAKQTG